MTSRRDFTKTLGAAAMGFAVRPLATSPQPLALTRKLDRVGLQLYTVRHEMEKDVAAPLAKVAAAGYQELEFAGYVEQPPAAVHALLDLDDLPPRLARIPSPAAAQSP